MNYKASYIIALYNKESYIVDCIDSILREKIDQIDLEVIVIDDGSTDNSLNLVKNLSEKYKEIIYDFFPINKGKVAAFNYAYKKSTGDFIFLLGADDTVEAGRTSKMINQSLKHQKSVYGGWRAFQETEGDIKDLSNNAKNYTIYQSIMHSRVPGGTICLGKKDADIVFPIPENLQFEDWWISTILISLNRLRPVDFNVLNYRITSSNDCFRLSRSWNAVKTQYLRHYDYLSMLNEKLKTLDLEYWFLRSRGLRDAFLYRKISTVKYLYPLDIESVKIILYIIFSSKYVHYFGYKILNLFKR